MFLRLTAVVAVAGVLSSPVTRSQAAVGQSEEVWLCRGRAPRRCVEPRHLGREELWMDSAGIHVLRDRAAWRRFLGRFWRSTQSPPLAAPSHDLIDWDTYVLVAVGVGALSGCDNRMRLVNRLEHRGRHSVVVIGPDKPAYEPHITCQMLIAPVDLVVIGRNSLPLEFWAGNPLFRMPPLR